LEHESYLIVFRAYPDVDHMAPLAWGLLEQGEEVHAVISPGYDAARDYRFAFLNRYPRFHLHEIAPHTLVRNTLPYALRFLRRHRVGALAVEWGFGLRAGYERLASPAGAAVVARSFARSLRHARDPQQTRASFMVAARMLGIPTVSLPHGLTIKLDQAITNDAAANGVARDWRDRNRFAAYVLNTEHHRQWHLDNFRGDPDVMQTWGSLRWSPTWFELNRRIAPAFEWPPADGRVKVAFMVPKWQNRVHPEAVVSLVKRLQSLPSVSLALKGHPRPADGGADRLRDDPEIDWSRIHDVTSVDSVSLIAASDVVIDIGSSIGIEVLMQGKVLVNPCYLHELTTLFDAIDGSCVVARDERDVVAYLERHAFGARHAVPGTAYDELLRRAVYGSRDEPFDVVRLYTDRIRELAAAG
jgi:hypothetical protein